MEQGLWLWLVGLRKETSNEETKHVVRLFICPFEEVTKNVSFICWPLLVLLFDHCRSYPDTFVYHLFFPFYSNSNRLRKHVSGLLKECDSLEMQRESERMEE